MVVRSTSEIFRGFVIHAAAPAREELRPLVFVSRHDRQRNGGGKGGAGEVAQQIVGAACG